MTDRFSEFLADIVRFIN